MLIWLVRSAITALYPRTTLPGAADCALDAFLVKFRREAPALVWLGVVAGALVFQLGPLFTVWLPLPAFALSRSLRDRHARGIAAAELYLVRQSIFLVKMVAGLCWGADPAVRARFSLPPLPEDPGTWRVD